MISKTESIILTGWRKNYVLLKIWVGIIYQLLNKYRNPLKLVKILQRINKMHKKSGVNKIAQIGNRYFLSPNFQSIPSKQFYKYVFQQANKVLGLEKLPSEQLSLAIFSVTKKCPLNCEHCCEAAILNQKEFLSDSDLETIVHKLMDYGVATYVFGGGEPMVRIKSLLKVIEITAKSSNSWIITSGFNVSTENAKKLKEAGLTGINVSVDHYDPNAHNKFRRNNNSFKWAMEALENANDAGLATAMTICVTKDFCTRENLMSYMDLAMKMKVPFVQILEPSAVGNYEGKDVLLLPKQTDILDQFYLDMKNKPEYAGYPIVLYHGYEYRRVGCLGAGIRNLYIDTDGYVHNCPMCRKTSGSILEHDVDELLSQTRNIGCSKFSEFVY